MMLALPAPDTTVFGLYLRLTRAQLKGDGVAVPEIEPPPGMTITLGIALPVSPTPPPPTSKLIRTGTPKNIIVLSTQDASSPRIGAVVDAFKAKQNGTAASEPLNPTPYLAGMTDVKTRRATHLLEQLMQAPAVTVAGVGKARMIQVLIPSAALEAR